MKYAVLRLVGTQWTVVRVGLTYSESIMLILKRIVNDHHKLEEYTIYQATPNIQVARALKEQTEGRPNR